MRRRSVAARTLTHTLLACVVLLVAVAGLGSSPAARAQEATLLYVQRPCTPVYAAPDAGSRLLTQLPGGADVTVRGAANAGWQPVRIWSSTDGFVRSDRLGASPPQRPSDGTCSFPGLPEALVDILPPDSGPFPLARTAVVSVPTTLYAEANDRSMPVTALAVGVVATISAWASDAGGRPWYQVRTASGQGWVWSAMLRLDAPNPATHQVGGRPLWQTVAGKGIWTVNYLPHHSDVEAMVQDAKRTGITHIYAEVAITRYGFYARNTLDRLLPAAHKAGIAVVAWVYPTLENVSEDVRLTLEVANYRTPSGDRADGIASDIEEVLDSASVYSYGQLVRAALGPDSLLVASVYHPFARAGYPYAAIAASFNVLSPMNYWHSRPNKTYSAEAVRRFVSTSFLTLRAAMQHASQGALLPIEETGQMYDMYTANGTPGGNAPTAAEILADMQTSRDLGAIGVSFFEWQTASQAQWQALRGFSWPVP